MSGGKGTSSTPVTNTATQTNPLARFVEGTANNLAPIATQGPYTAPPDPRQFAGYDFLSNTGNNLAGWPTAKQYDAYGNLIIGGGTSPAMSGYSTLAAGGSGPQQTLDQVVNYGVNNALNFANPIAAFANQAAGGNVGQDQLAAAAQGKYTNVDSNPYLRQSADAALGAAERSYQRGTSPETAARFAGGGRYGSGANDAAIRANEESFLRGQGDITNKFYGDQYRFERGQQDADAIAFDQARRAGLGLGITGLGTAGNLVDQGLRTVTAAANPNLLAQTEGLRGIDTGFGRTITTQEAALRDYNNFAAGQFIPGNADIQAGTGLRDLDTSVLQEPYKRANAFLQAISGAGANAAGSSGSSTTPYYTNNIASAISGLSGAASLGKQLGIGSLFSGGGGGAGAGALISGDYGGGGILGNVAAETFAPAAAEAGGKAAAETAGSFLPFIFSDRRLKEDYKVIGKVGALPLYSFRYKGDPTPRIGFMADEVEKVDPGAVHSMVGGFKAVDYERAVKSALK